MDVKRDMLLMHFQLRNVLASTSRAQTFYTANHAVLHFDPLSGRTKTIMRVPYSQVSTIAAKHGVLAAGCFNGEYILRRIDSESDSAGCEVGTITRDAGGITNHIQIYESRTGGAPLAAIASNDKGLRVLDVTDANLAVYSQVSGTCQLHSCIHPTNACASWSAMTRAYTLWLQTQPFPTSNLIIPSPTEPS